MSDEIEKAQVFDSIKIGLASPEQIRSWSKGEVKKPETINYRTLKPEFGGLFCERIFGPSKDGECSCGKYKRIRYKGVICDRCGVEVNKAKVRRERMGHIELAAPVSHIWYFRGIPSRMGLILGLSPKELEQVLYFASYIVLKPGNQKETGLLYKQILNEQQYRDAYEKHGKSFTVGMGAEAVNELLSNIDLEKESIRIKRELAGVEATDDVAKIKAATGQKKTKLIKQLEVIESFKSSGNKPEWMILKNLPVMPPDLRPMVQLDGGRFATSDLNDLYRRVINRNNRLVKLLSLGAPDIIVRNEKRMLQEAVDSLIDNGRRSRPVTGPGNRQLKSLSELLKGKQGRFRQNLLGKRVDYSGRSVIVVGPELKLHQCGLPKEMALELFKPFVMKELVGRGISHNIKSAKKMIENLDEGVWDVLEEVIKEHPVMLNRAPTLHRLSIQAFEPLLIEGKSIKLHPLVCSAYNADFDGDQMAVHVPLSVEAQAECRFLLLAPNNLLKPSDGEPVAVPSQDMVLGIYYLTIQKEGEKGENKIFANENEAILAYDNDVISLHAKIKVRRTLEFNGEKETQIITTTVGRIIFNEAIPQDLGFIDRTIEENKFKYEIEFLCDKKMLGSIISKCINKFGSKDTSYMLDEIKRLGFKFATKGAFTVAVSDMDIPGVKYKLLQEAEVDVEKTGKAYRRGLLTEEERYIKVIKTWNEVTDKITAELVKGLGQYNNIYMMADSGARGTINQIKQLSGMRGLMNTPTGEIIELPIKSNFREGLTVIDYFISASGARKGLADTALRTADSGYLTRRLVDIAQDITIRETDCISDGEEVPGMVVSAFMDGDEKLEPLEDRLRGRWSVEEIIHPKTKEVLVKADTLISPSQAIAVEESGITEVKIRTILTCKSKTGLCSKCYGVNMASGRTVGMGEAVGIIAAQSIGEPGTQLTMRTFHTGGIVSNRDITQGLPRIEEIFEARKPKGVAIVAEESGIIQVVNTGKKKEVVIKNDESDNIETYLIPYGSRLIVEDGEFIEAGECITEGSIYPQDILRIKGSDGVQFYMLREVQRVYRLQGVDINDKHVEVIVRQMLRRIRVEDNGDTMFLQGSLVDWLDFEEGNREAVKNGGEPAKGERVLLGITKASLTTDSFLSAASFQETTRVLTEAATKGKVDKLIGLKENVIIGKLIPAGTGMDAYKKINVEVKDEFKKVKEVEIVEDGTEIEPEKIIKA